MLAPDDLSYIDIRPLQVTHRSTRVIGWGCVVLFSWFLTLGIINHQTDGLLTFLFFIWLGILLLCLYGTTEWDTQRIGYRAAIGRYEMLWSDVKHVEIDPRGTNLVFYGDNQRLVIPGPLFWSGRQKINALKLLLVQVQRHQVEVRETAWAAYKRSKNTKVR